MFTGIVEEIGSIKSISAKPEGLGIIIESNHIAENTKIGDSIAINGICLTVTSILNKTFSTDVSFETVNRTNIGKLKINDKVNLERALTANGRFDGHIVLGHIDTTARIRSITKIGEFYILSLDIDNYIFDHCVDKGSIAVDGISLTISKLTASFLEAAIIPHTFEHTSLKFKRIGDLVNIEVDILSKYVEKMLKKSKIDVQFLAKHGFA